jgi:hypothetical protein
LLPLSWIGCSGEDGLVGSWRHSDALGYVESWELSADGRVTYEWMNEFGTPRIVEGDYTVEGDTLHIDGEYVHEPGTSILSEKTFYAGSDRASIPAFVPIGGHVGWVGTWTMRYHDRFIHDDGRPETLSGGEEVLELDPDGSARWERTHDDGSEPELLTGTWREIDGAIELIQVEDGDEFVGIGFPTLDGAALAQFPLERVE